MEYLNSRDATIMGSRNGHAPIYMWYTFTRKGYEGLRKDVERCLRNAHLLRSMLERAGVVTSLNELSSTVVFERPADEDFVRRWQLACQGDIAHVVVMPNITVAKLERFVTELIAVRCVVVGGWGVLPIPCLPARGLCPSRMHPDHPTRHHTPRPAYITQGKELAGGRPGHLGRGHPGGRGGGVRRRGARR